MEQVFRLFEHIHNLKSLQRQGWVLKGLVSPESVAEHSFGVALISMALAEKIELDAGKCIEMALLHDLAESLTKDITPRDKISREDKEKAEDAAIKSILWETGMQAVVKLWEEYKTKATKEARLVHDADKIEILLQALEYEKQYPALNLDEFYEYVGSRLMLEESKPLYSQILQKRVRDSGSR